MKKHNYKSLEDAIKAMLDGQEFWYAGHRIYCDMTIMPDFFRCEWTDKKPDEPLDKFWEEWQDWQIKPSWTDDLSPDNPVLCWVWSGGARWDNPVNILSYKKGIYESYTTTQFYKAIPVKPEECWQGDIEE